ncbi:MAG TPA: PadR family transcriptional regulator [Streptosporangiaceae bacterium]|nr:PadR family transcriptional regulator [Streptosporangiaceae bacterium]
MDATFRPSPLAVAVLSMLAPGPLHPYGIQRLIKHWGKDQVVNVGQRANLYKTINRLHEAGLIAVRQTERDQQYPERTVYELTAEGWQKVREWLADMLATPRNEFPQFPAALSFAMLLDPDRILAALERRAAVLREALDGLDQTLASVAGTLPRVTLLDDEYRRAVTAAELNWVGGVIENLRAGTLTWSEDELARVAIEDLGDLAKSLVPEYMPEPGKRLGAER